MNNKEDYRTIQCGILVNNSIGVPTRIYRMYCEFFKSEVEVFSVVPKDQEYDNQVYYRGSDLARKLGIPSNSFAMFLKRKKDVLNGICQASKFLDKAVGSYGLKYGCYCVSESACYVIARMLHNERGALVKKDSQFSQGEPAITLNSVSSSSVASTTSSSTIGYAIQNPPIIPSPTQQMTSFAVIPPNPSFPSYSSCFEMSSVPSPTFYYQPFQENQAMHAYVSLIPECPVYFTMQ